VPSGEIWGAKDLIYQHIGERAQETVMSYKEDPRGPPDPAFVEGLANQIREGSNFYAVQKMLDGPFSIDIIYEAEDVHQHIDGKPSNDPLLWALVTTFHFYRCLDQPRRTLICRRIYPALPRDFPNPTRIPTQLPRILKGYHIQSLWWHWLLLRGLHCRPCF